MAEMTPYAQIVGPAKIYLAPYGTAEPTVNTTPGSDWTELGATDGEQTFEFGGELTFFTDDSHQSHVKAVRGDEELIISFTLVDTTQEKVARVLSDASKITTSSGPPAVKRLPNKRGATPTEYAMLVKGESDSPYGDFPGQNYIPRCVSNSAPKTKRGKAMRQELDCVFVALEDDNQTEDNRLGWQTVQTS